VAVPEGRAAGNTCEAGAGGWASVLVDGWRLTMNGQVIAGEYGGLGPTAGRTIVVADRNPDRWHGFDLPTGSHLWTRGRPAGSNLWRTSADGWIGFGYYGPAALELPDGTPRDVTLAPWATEGLVAVVKTPDGTRWAWSGTYDPTGAGWVYGRPLTPDGRLVDDRAICLELRSQGDAFDVWADPAGSFFRIAAFANVAPIGPVLRILDVPADTPRTRVPVPVTPIPPKPPDPEPPPMKPPKITITSYTPTTVTIGGEPCKAVYGLETGSGPLARIEWLTRPDGPGTPWLVVASNDPADPDHSFRWTQPGVWLIAARGVNDAGTHQTGARRAVTVQPATVPPEPIPPAGPKTLAIRTQSGFLFCAENGGGREVNATRTGIPDIWESFHPVPQADGTVALRADNGMYLSADQNTGLLMADRTAIGRDSAGRSWECFTLEVDPDGEVAIRGTGGYLWAEDGGGGAVRVNGDRLDDWSVFLAEPGSTATVLPPPGSKPSIELAGRVHGAFLGVPNYTWGFMYPGWSAEKRAAYRMTLKAAGLTHIPFAAWGAYGSEPQFDFRRNPQGLRDLITETQADGCVVVLFGITDGLPGDPGYTEDDAHLFIKNWLSQFTDLIRIVATGWEFPQINSGFGDKTAPGSTTGNLPGGTGAPVAVDVVAWDPRPHGVETAAERAHHVLMRKIRRLRESAEGTPTGHVLAPGPHGYSPLGPHSNRLYFAWSGDAHLRIAQTLRQTFGSDALVYCHFTPERITGWPDYNHTSSDPRGEADWWATGDKSRHLTGILYQRPPDEPEQYTQAHTTGGTDEDGGHDIGDAERITHTWGINRTMVAFEFSRDMGRSARLAKVFNPDPRLSGNTNQPA